MKTLWQRWRRARRLKKVPRRTYIVATTYERARYAASRLGLDPNARTTAAVLNPRAIEGMRFLPGDRIVAEGWPDHVREVILRNLISSGVGVKSRDMVDFEVIK